MIIFCDIDGTLCPHSAGKLDLESLHANLDAAQHWRRAGHLFAAATGRGIASVRRLIPSCDQLFDFILVDNGGYVFHHDHHPILQNTLSSSLTKAIPEVLARHLSPRDFQISYYTFSNEIEHPGDQPIGKIRVWFFDPAHITIATQALRDEFGDQLQIHPERHDVRPMLPWLDHSLCAFINITDAAASKELAIRQIATQYQIPESQILTIGDDVNDLAMLQQFDGYAMQDSNPLLFEMIPPAKRFASVADFINKKLA